ncbi:MAG: hypothetical protein UW86_C0014G0007 [Microgenomates group bacterium GW2011_GWA1_Microgenomates_45_10]|nr:MAG: hypothetical protein UW69_C0047G0006 [Microgenomates group bacterium GW2011_GWA2_44_7]KKT77930.1 MAG: hypothetical protein UW73_C0009G0029 [Microgenomates group bacterium GW2011_GWB1_44_8]KKT86933.1 MAG: hypothetical protein UW86_C0014G0007 [Microgenomates group bacterium GW2011_GWA1_Microgenomates_45_10]
MLLPYSCDRVRRLPSDEEVLKNFLFEFDRYMVKFKIRARGSAVERFPDKKEVDGSTPSAPTVVVSFPTQAIWSFWI